MRHGRGKFSSEMVSQVVCALGKDMVTMGMAKTEHKVKKGTIVDLWAST